MKNILSIAEKIILENAENDYEKAIKICVGDTLTDDELVKLKNLMQATVKLSVVTTLMAIEESTTE